MIYLDYSATSPVLDEVLDTFVKVNKSFIGNPNSLHKLGIEAKQLLDQATLQISNILGIKPQELIYTSGASESNNLAIKGIINKYPNRGKQIITTALEHSSVLEPLKKLEKKGYKISFVKLNGDGTVNLENLKELLKEDTVLVTIASVSSEVGIRQPIEEIGKLLKEYPKCFFHTDITQSLGKVNVSLKDVDLASFSAHKFYGLKGIGGLVKRENVVIEPLIDGGKSTTVYRSGTPALALIVSMAKALRLSTENILDKIKHVQLLNEYLKKQLNLIEEVHVNSTEKSIFHILNFSIDGIKPETMLHALEMKDIYISTMSACSSNKSESLAVKSITNNKNYASTSLRVSLSYQTTLDEVKIFIKELQECIKELHIR